MILKHDLNLYKVGKQFVTDSVKTEIYGIRKIMGPMRNRSKRVNYFIIQVILRLPMICQLGDY